MNRGQTQTCADLFMGIINSAAKIMRVRSWGISWLIILGWPAALPAADITFTPGLDIRAEYDDDVYYSRQRGVPDVEDGLIRITPAFTLDYETERLDLKTRAAMDILRYNDETNLDTEYHNYMLNGAYKLTERFDLLADASYIKDTTLESELWEKGLLTDIRQDRERTTGGGGVRYLVSELSNIEFHYTYSETEYESSQDADYRMHYISLSFNRLLRNQLDMLTIQPYYQTYDSDTAEYSFPGYSYSYSSKSDNYGLSIGWKHVVSETFSFTAFLGARYTETESKNKYSYFYLYGMSDTDDSSINGVADISLTKIGETYTANLGYNRDLSYSAEGEPINTDRVSLRFSRRMSERLRLGFRGSYHLTKSDDDSDRGSRDYDRDSRYYTLTPFLRYQLTKHHFLGLSYSYSHSEDKEAWYNETIRRNRVWISLNLRWPQK